MSFVLREGPDRAYPFPHGASSSINAGELCTYDRSNKVVIPGTASLKAEDVACVTVEDADSAAGEVMAIPVRGSSQLWEWDTTNNTADNQLCIRHVLTDAATVANTSSDQAVDEIVVTPIRNVGAASDKKQEGFINLVPATLS